MPFSNLVGNEKVKKLLKDIIKQGNITHSYMFIGNDGIGKLEFAKQFAKMILCNQSDTYCNNCKSCLQFNTSNHPDFNIIQKDGDSIKIEQIRNMVLKIAEKPIVSSKKIYIINDSSYMTKEAQNCLLKTLEEPPDYVVIILIASDENLFLNTIKSRCTKIVFNKIEDEILKEYLKKQYNIKNISNSMLELYNGSIKKAIELSEMSEIYQKIDEIFNNINKKDLIDILNLSEIIYKSKEQINQILEYINIILFNLGKQDVKYLKCVKFVEKAKTNIKANANFDMSIDSLLISSWEEIFEK